eukprot:1054104-Ditylum_brightwellii.AAC.1
MKAECHYYLHRSAKQKGMEMLPFYSPIEADNSIKVAGNVGVLSINVVGFLGGYGDAWINKNIIANIISLKSVRQRIRVTYDSARRETFKVHKADEALLFKEHKSELYYHDTAD